MNTGRSRPLARCVKRMLDLGVAASGLILASPLLLLIAVTIRLSLGHPVFFNYLCEQNKRIFALEQPSLIKKLKILLETAN